MSIAHFAPPWWAMARSMAAAAAARPAMVGSGSPIAATSSGSTAAIVVDRLAVEAIRVALADPDVLGKSVVP